MKKEIVEIGDKYAARFKRRSWHPWSYVSSSGRHTWSSVRAIIDCCTAMSVEEAEEAMSIYLKEFKKVKDVK